MSSAVGIQTSFASGELSPSLLGRQDLDKYHHGASTCRNFFVDYRGGVQSRAGLAYVGMCKQPGSSSPPRDIPFQFNLNQGYVLEFGDTYMRIKSNGAYVTEPTVAVSSVSIAALFTTGSAHGYSVGDWVYDVGNTGFNGLTWIVNTVPSSTTFTVTDLFGNVISLATASTTGTVARIYTVVAPYAAVDLPFLKYTQSADTMTLTCVNTGTNTEYPPYDLVRSGNTNWTFTQETFSASTTAPTSLVAVAQASNTLTTYYSYVVTAVNRKTGEESVASLPVNVQNCDIAINAGSNSLTWAEVSGSSSYNVYASTPSYGEIVPVSSLYGFIGHALGPAFTDTNITPDFTKVPPVHNNPFARGLVLDVVATAAGTNYSQNTIGYSVTTSTGTGFSGTPVVANGGLAGFVIYNQGQGYLAGDTITFSDSGGGLATGSFNVTGIPANNSTITVGNGTYKFVFTGFEAIPYLIPIQGTTALQAQAIAQYLNATVEVGVASATYTASGSTVTMTYKTPGTAGNAFTYNAFAQSGTLSGGGTVGSGATATLTIGPQTGTYPGVPAYFQQRRVYASTLNNPDTYYMSQPGLFSNMDSSIPTTASDSITGTPWAQQVNGIQFLVPMPGGLVVLTGKGAWQVNGGANAAITPSSQVATPQAYNGCHNHVGPITINYDIIYVQSKGSIIRDLSYNFFVNIYTGTDLTVLSNHLFSNHQIQQWAYAEEPYKLIWVVRDDGVLLCLTYLKEQDVYAWSRHDTNGLFQSVVSITEPPVDAVYVIVSRYVQGAWRYYSERMDNRLWANVEQSFCVDAGLTYPQTFPNATLYPASAKGASVPFIASSAVFNSGMVGNVIRAGGGIATILSYQSATQVTCKITQPITIITSDDPNNRPIPSVNNPNEIPLGANAGSWSISVPTSSVSGLNHLEGLTVTCLADGSVVPSQVVTNGTITLPEPASNIVVGLPYTCQLQTMYLDHTEQSGTTQNRRKNISAVGIRLESSRGLQLGADQPDASAQQNGATLPWTNMNEIKDRTMFVNAGSAVPLYTGDYYKAITSGWDLRGQVAVQQVYPLPATVLSVIPYFNTGDDR